LNSFIILEKNKIIHYTYKFHGKTPKRKFLNFSFQFVYNITNNISFFNNKKKLQILEISNFERKKINNNYHISTSFSSSKLVNFASSHFFFKPQHVLSRQFFYDLSTPVLYNEIIKYTLSSKMSFIVYKISKKRVSYSNILILHKLLDIFKKRLVQDHPFDLIGC
jgi:hypothetical protein